jgi:hypothetical protein
MGRWIKQVKVVCPKCDDIIVGEEEKLDNTPFVSCYASCPKCKYVVTESEWEVAEEGEKIYEKDKSEVNDAV